MDILSGFIKVFKNIYSDAKKMYCDKRQEVLCRKTFLWPFIL